MGSNSHYSVTLLQSNSLDSNFFVAWFWRGFLESMLIFFFIRLIIIVLEEDLAPKSPLFFWLFKHHCAGNFFLDAFFQWHGWVTCWRLACFVFCQRSWEETFQKHSELSVPALMITVPSAFPSTSLSLTKVSARQSSHGWYFLQQ